MKATEFLKHVKETNEALLSAAFVPEYWDEAVARIQQVVGSDHASIFIRTTDNPRLVNAVGMRVPQDAIKDYLEYGVDDFDGTLLFRRFLELVPEGKPYDTIDLVNYFKSHHDPSYRNLYVGLRQQLGCNAGLSDDAVFRRTRLYNEWCRKHGTNYMAGVKVTIDDAYIADLALYRSNHSPVYEQRAKLFIEQITPCLKFALCSMSRSRELFAVREALDRLSFGLIVLDITGRAHHCNRIASRLIAESEDIHIIGGRVQLSSREADAQLKDFIHQLSRKTNSQVPREFIIGVQTAQVRVVLVPLHEGLCAGLWGHLYPAVIFLYESAPQRVEDLRRILRDDYGCSAAESNVGAMYACGMTRNKISLTIHVIEETIKSHLKSVFRKMRVQSKGELILKLQSKLLPSHNFGR